MSHCNVTGLRDEVNFKFYTVSDIEIDLGIVGLSLCGDSAGLDLILMQFHSGVQYTCMLGRLSYSIGRHRFDVLCPAE